MANDEVTYDEIEEVKQECCDGCKGLYRIHESKCYLGCKPFQEELIGVKEKENA